MRTVNMHEAKSQLSKLVAAVESGVEDEIIIARNGKPAVKMTLATLKRGGIKLGLARGRFTAPDNFDADNEEIGRLMEEGSLFPDE